MLADPKKIVIPGQVDSITLNAASNNGYTTDQLLSLGLVDLAPGKSVRTGTLADGRKATLTVSHSVSNENKGTLTDRAAMRLDIRKNVADVGSVTAQATLTVSTPRDGFTPSDTRDIVASLMAAIMSTDGTNYAATSGVSISMSTETEDTLGRVIRGEP